MARAHDVSRRAFKRMANVMKALLADDKETLAQLQSEDPYAHTPGSSATGEQIAGSAGKEANPKP